MNELVITEKGQELIAKLYTKIDTITFTKVKVSSHEYNNDILKSLTELDNVEAEINVSNVKVYDSSVVQVLAAMDNSKLTKGFYAKTIGLYAKNSNETEILYALATDDKPDYIPAFNGKTLTGITYKLNTKVGTSEQVIIKIDPANAATVEQVELLENELNNKVKEFDTKLSSKADKSDVENKLSNKADKSDVENKLSNKADKADVESKLSNKADKADVESKLSNKADKADVESKLSNKADKADVESKLSNKADKSDAENVFKLVPYSNDLNTLYTSGFYSLRSCSNKPADGTAYAALIVSKTDATTDKSLTDTMQMYIDQNNNIFVRNCTDKSDNTWTEWKKIGQDKVDKVDGKGLSTNDFTNDWLELLKDYKQNYIFDNNVINLMDLIAILYFGLKYKLFKTINGRLNNTVDKLPISCKFTIPAGITMIDSSVFEELGKNQIDYVIDVYDTQNGSDVNNIKTLCQDPDGFISILLKKPYDKPTELTFVATPISFNNTYLKHDLVHWFGLLEDELDVNSWGKFGELKKVFDHD